MMSDMKAWGFARFFWKREIKDAFSADWDPADYSQGVLQDSSELGDAVHEWIEADLFGLEFPDVSNMNQMFWECVAEWNAFKAEHEIVPHRVENTVWNESELGYAGTFDLLVEVDGRLMLIDIKTSRGIYTSTWMQLAALYNAPVLLDEGEDGVDRFIEDWQKPIEGLGVLHVRPNDDKGAAFCELLEMPGDHSTWFGGFMGLRQYVEAVRSAPKPN